eukprot:2575928-Amphidinium_carterae.1
MGCRARACSECNTTVEIRGCQFEGCTHFWCPSHSIYVAGDGRFLVHGDDVYLLPGARLFPVCCCTNSHCHVPSETWCGMDSVCIAHGGTPTEVYSTIKQIRKIDRLGAAFPRNNG